MATSREPGRPHLEPEEDARSGRLAFRPAPPGGSSPSPGPAGPVRLDSEHGSALVHVPPPGAGDSLRLVLLLHGAGGSAQQGLDLLAPVADAAGLLLVAPQSTRATWDVIGGGYGPDVRHVDHLLGRICADHPVGALTVAGFSDGGSYALSLGIANGDVFDAVVAFSPGFAAPLVTHGRPRFYLSHGRSDAVLPVDRCSRRLVPQLRGAGYPVTYDEFDGGHAVPPAVVARAVAWLGAGAPSGAGPGEGAGRLRG